MLIKVTKHLLVPGLYKIGKTGYFAIVVKHDGELVIRGQFNIVRDSLDDFQLIPALGTSHPMRDYGDRHGLHPDDPGDAPIEDFELINLD